MDKRKFARAKKVAVASVAVIGAMAASVVNSQAALTWTDVTLNTADVESAMSKIIVGLAVLWGFRKIVKTMNRS